MDQIPGNPHVAVFRASVSALEVPTEDFAASYQYWTDGGGYFRLELGPITMDVGIDAAERLRDHLDWVLQSYRKNPKSECRHPENTRRVPEKIVLALHDDSNDELPELPDF